LRRCRPGEEDGCAWGSSDGINTGRSESRPGLRKKDDNPGDNHFGSDRRQGHCHRFNHVHRVPWIMRIMRTFHLPQTVTSVPFSVKVGISSRKARSWPRWTRPPGTIYLQNLTTALQNAQRSLTTAQSTLASNQRAVTTAQLNVTQGQLKYTIRPEQAGLRPE